MRILRRAPPRALARAMIAVRGLWIVVGEFGESDVLLDEARVGVAVLVDADGICGVNSVVLVEVVNSLLD